VFRKLRWRCASCRRKSDGKSPDGIWKNCGKAHTTQQKAKDWAITKDKTRRCLIIPVVAAAFLGAKSSQIWFSSLVKKNAGENFGTAKGAKDTKIEGKAGKKIGAEK
jgi:hypothetical protein